MSIMFTNVFNVPRIIQGIQKSSKRVIKLFITRLGYNEVEIQFLNYSDLKQQDENFLPLLTGPFQKKRELYPTFTHSRDPVD